MISVGELRRRLAADLADPDLSTWSWPQLAGYLDEAADVIVRRKPDAFVRERILTLHGGREWHPICDCLRLVRDNVIGQCDSEGTVTRRLAGVLESALWPGEDLPPRADRKPFRLREFSVSDDGLKIRVYPRIPPGTTVHVLARCPVMPDWFDHAEEVDGSLAVALVQWAMYRALMIDGERGPAVAAAAASHLELFNSFVGGGVRDAPPRRRESSDAG